MTSERRDLIQMTCIAILFALVVVVVGFGLRAAFGAEAKPGARLVITMETAEGEDFEGQMEMQSLEECWERARITMEHMRSPDNHDQNVKSIGVGCVVNIATGDPA